MRWWAPALVVIAAAWAPSPAHAGDVWICERVGTCWNCEIVVLSDTEVPFFCSSRDMACPDDHLCYIVSGASRCDLGRSCASNADPPPTCRRIAGSCSGADGRMLCYARCAPSTGADGGSGRDGGVRTDAGGGTDGGTRADGGSRMDADPQMLDAGRATGSRDISYDFNGTGGCACRAAPATPLGGALVMSAMVWLLLVGRRRRRP